MRSIFLRAFFFCTAVFLASAFSATAEESGGDEARPSRRTEFFVTGGPNLMVSTSGNSSAPSPIMYSLGFGAEFPAYESVLLQGRASFFSNYYLWDGDDARPAEIENRTATALSLLLGFDAGRSWFFGENRLSVCGGLGFLLRAAFLAGGVSSDDEGGSGTTAGDDVSSINSWFYSGLRFLYPECSVKYLRALPGGASGMQFGAEARFLFPLGAIISGDFPDSMIFSLAAVFQF